MKNVKRTNKKGFTLSEMLIVVAIIVILSGATAIGIVSSINKAKQNAAKLEENNGDNFESEAMRDVFTAKGTLGSDVPNQTNVDTPSPTPAETTKAPTEEPTKTPTRAADPTSTPTPVPPTATPVPATATPTPAGGGDKVVGGVTVHGGYNTDMQNGVGVTKVTDKGNGAYDIDAHTSSNKITLSLTPIGGGKYKLSVTNGMQWMLQGMPGYSDSSGYNDFANGSVREINPDGVAWLQNKWGFSIGS